MLVNSNIKFNITVRDFDSVDVPVVTKVRQPMYTKMQLNQSLSGNAEQANLTRSRPHFKPYEQSRSLCFLSPLHFAIIRAAALISDF